MAVCKNCGRDHDRDVSESEMDLTYRGEPGYLNISFKTKIPNGHLTHLDPRVVCDKFTAGLTKLMEEVFGVKSPKKPRIFENGKEEQHDPRELIDEIMQALLGGKAKVVDLNDLSDFLPPSDPKLVN